MTCSRGRKGKQNPGCNPSMSFKGTHFKPDASLRRPRPGSYPLSLTKEALRIVGPSSQKNGSRCLWDRWGTNRTQNCPSR
ncbi:hypothetical protein NPIL_388351 [Nephila pilipes]|uniref:Uncharacterized protein n=1 Tax=Nephila pilipes TaxID=299642 RepID=A0A8X6UPE6_NEPPI|nr:hypothetical protein NPIL_388351 [Nephila pilipes]